MPVRQRQKIQILLRKIRRNREVCSILLSAASCGNREQHAVSKTENNAETTEQPTTETAETDTVKFVDYLTENGSGIARKVQPAYGMKELYAKQRDGSDLRWYDGSLLSEQEAPGIFVVTTSTGKNYSFFSPEQKNAPFAGLAKIDPAGIWRTQKIIP